MRRVVYRRGVCGAAANSVAVPVGAFVYEHKRAKKNKTSPRKPFPRTDFRIVAHLLGKNDDDRILFSTSKRDCSPRVRVRGQARVCSASGPWTRAAVYSHGSHKIQVVFLQSVRILYLWSNIS